MIELISIVLGVIAAGYFGFTGEVIPATFASGFACLVYVALLTVDAVIRNAYQIKAWRTNVTFQFIAAGLLCVVFEILVPNKIDNMFYRGTASVILFILSLFIQRVIDNGVFKILGEVKNHYSKTAKYQ